MEPIAKNVIHFSTHDIFTKEDDGVIVDIKNNVVEDGIKFASTKSRNFSATEDMVRWFKRSDDSMMYELPCQDFSVEGDTDTVFTIHDGYILRNGQKCVEIAAPTFLYSGATFTMGFELFSDHCRAFCISKYSNQRHYNPRKIVKDIEEISVTFGMKDRAEFYAISIIDTRKKTHVYVGSSFGGSAAEHTFDTPFPCVCVVDWKTVAVSNPDGTISIMDLIKKCEVKKYRVGTTFKRMFQNNKLYLALDADFNLYRFELNN